MQQSNSRVVETVETRGRCAMHQPLQPRTAASRSTAGYTITIYSAQFPEMCVRVLILILLIAAAGAGFWVWTARGHSPAATPSPAILTARAVPPDGNWGPLGVMTANIRISSTADGDNIWPNRRELVVKTFLKYQPEIIACQEAAPAQGAYLNKELEPWYDAYWRPGIGTDAGMLNETLGSLDRIYYRSDRFEAIDGDTGFILPKEPQADPAENALFTLVVLKEKGSGSIFIVEDVHLRHQDAFAVRCATAVRANIGAWMKKYPGKNNGGPAVIVTGDMNHDRTSDIYPALLGGVPAASDTPSDRISARDGLPVLSDAFDYSSKPPGIAWGNFHNFTGKVQSQWPTDLILFTGLEIRKPAAVSPAAGGGISRDAGGFAQIIRDQGPGGRFPSDHFFVLAELQRPGK